MLQANSADIHWIKAYNELQGYRAKNSLKHKPWEVAARLDRMQTREVNLNLMENNNKTSKGREGWGLQNRDAKGDLTNKQIQQTKKYL